MPKLQPIPIDMHALGNPWINYSIYLNNTFMPGLLQLMIFLVTVFSIGTEMKHGTSQEWLRRADNSIIIAMTGKLLPQTIIFFAVGLMCQSLLYGYLHFPMNGNIWHMILAMFLLVIASQSMAVIMMSFAPSLRIGLSIAGLTGILAISITGFSFPVPAMYTPFQVITNILPLRHYFLIYVDSGVEWNTFILFENTLYSPYLFCSGFTAVAEAIKDGFGETSLRTMNKTPELKKER